MLFTRVCQLCELTKNHLGLNPKNLDSSKSIAFAYNKFDIAQILSIKEQKNCGKQRQEGHDGPGVAHLSLRTKHNQFPTSCEIYVLPNNKILNSLV